MTNQLAIHLPESTLTFESDNVENLADLSDFCKEELGAYHSNKNINELTVDSITEEMNNKLNSKIFELGLL